MIVEGAICICKPLGPRLQLGGGGGAAHQFPLARFAGAHQNQSAAPIHSASLSLSFAYNSRQ